jgi:hypothetical protein
MIFAYMESLLQDLSVGFPTSLEVGYLPNPTIFPIRNTFGNL